MGSFILPTDSETCSVPVALIALTNKGSKEPNFLNFINKHTIIIQNKHKQVFDNIRVIGQC